MMIEERHRRGRGLGSHGKQNPTAGASLRPCGRRIASAAAPTRRRLMSQKTRPKPAWGPSPCTPLPVAVRPLGELRSHHPTIESHKHCRPSLKVHSLARWHSILALRFTSCLQTPGSCRRRLLQSSEACPGTCRLLHLHCRRRSRRLSRFGLVLVARPSSCRLGPPRHTTTMPFNLARWFIEGEVDW